MYHPKMRQFDDTLKSIFDDLDNYLEDKYGHMFPLHPNRPQRNATANPEMDGLFNVGASFTAGFGTAYGRGYAVDIHLSTLSHVEEKLLQEIEDDVVEQLRIRIPEKFPDRVLHIEKDGNVIKIFGDLSLGTI